MVAANGADVVWMGSGGPCCMSDQFHKGCTGAEGGAEGCAGPFHGAACLLLDTQYLAAANVLGAL